MQKGAEYMLDVIALILTVIGGIAAVWCISLLFRDNDLIEK